MGRGVADLAHLARRFLWSLRPKALSASDEAWVRGWLTPPLFDLWAAQSVADRAHSLAVARAVIGRGVSGARGTQAAPGPDVLPSWVVVAALTHDVGKSDARLGAAGRAVATVAELVGLRRVPGRLGRYLDYPATGARWLAGAGAPAAVAAWARQHHEPPAAWEIPPRWGELLAWADHNASQ